ncbi:MAG: hypothetical protein QXJ32_05090 [Thermoplasmata archaeon]
MRLRIDRVAALWGLAFGVAATLTGMYVLSAVQGGFVAEGFFLVVLFWVLLLVGVAKLAERLRRR